MKKNVIIVFLFLFIANSFSQKTNNRKMGDNQVLNLIDFSKPVHSLGFSLYSGINFAPKVIYNSGPIEPKINNAFTPEFTLQYSCIFKNNFGFSLEIPFGIFKRSSYYYLEKYNINDVRLEVGSAYIGFSPKINYLKELSPKIYIQVEFGLKFMPFYYSSEHWSTQELDINNPNSTINYLIVPQENYPIPDATTSILFFIHGKNKQKNFVVGITANLSFVERMIFVYDTYESEVPFEYYSFGQYGFTSSSIGITLGYRFIGLKP